MCLCPHLLSCTVVEDINLALTVLNADKVYGLTGAERGQYCASQILPTRASAPPASAAVSGTDTTATVVKGRHKVDLGTI